MRRSSWAEQKIRATRRNAMHRRRRGGRCGPRQIKDSLASNETRRRCQRPRHTRQQVKGGFGRVNAGGLDSARESET
ncbi:Os03g0315302 [Oryza sativa Japonica Group]|uniref:Os03g0315302 protein n=1 Tax=Oryza sativa subsp. japonica TaxID=39947 RepID=A0A0P0VWT4_ORYSJ|nr:Os03g0315302 [Oryza sativa Japonica Group]